MRLPHPQKSEAHEAAVPGDHGDALGFQGRDGLEELGLRRTEGQARLCLDVNSKPLMPKQYAKSKPLLQKYVKSKPLRLSIVLSTVGVQVNW